MANFLLSMAADSLKGDIASDLGGGGGNPTGPDLIGQMMNPQQGAQTAPLDPNNPGQVPQDPNAQKKPSGKSGLGGIVGHLFGGQ